ncbi:MAG: NAD-dependent epimerase/dehydratase family protein [Terriglobales bacterium]|jgi:dTDP-glucose 4,6-dehydratase
MTNRLADELDNILARTECLWSDLRGGRILITGATGFFGCWLLESFAWANQSLHLNAQAVALSRNPAALAQKAPHLAANPAITLHAADVRHGDFPSGEFSHVIHAATEASARLNGEAPLVMFDTIVEGTRGTLRCASAANVARFLFVSSGAVYGTQPSELAHVRETYSGGPDPLDRGSAYAEGKRAAELLCALAASPRMATPIARCFAFVGPYMQMDAHFAIGNFISDALRGGPIQIKGDGTAVRSYLYASDLTVWLWTTLFNGRSGRAYNIGSEDALNIAELADEVSAAVPCNAGISRAAAPVAGASIHRYVPSTARAREELGLSAEIPLPEAIRRTYSWFAHKHAPAHANNARGAGV